MTNGALHGLSAASRAGGRSRARTGTLAVRGLARREDRPFSRRDPRRVATRAARALNACALAAVVAIGCASEAPKEREVLLEAHKEVFLLLPLNVAAKMEEQLEIFRPAVWEELEVYLRGQGKELKTVAPNVARSLWLKSIKKVRSGENGLRAGYDDAAAELARELRSHAEFDAMIVPALFVREAAISGRTARWDGVERRLEFKATGIDARALSETPLEGVAPAASLHVGVFGPDGEKLHEALGGIEVLVRVRGFGSNLSGAPSFRFTPRADLLASRAPLREGIATAFSPFLPPIGD